jgi:hypothetical protein
MNVSKEIAKLNPTTKEIADVLRNSRIKDASKEKHIYFYVGKPRDARTLAVVHTLEDVDKMYEQGFIFVGMKYRWGKDMRSAAYMCRMSVKETAKQLAKVRRYLRSHPKK